MPLDQVNDQGVPLALPLSAGLGLRELPSIGSILLNDVAWRSLSQCMGSKSRALVRRIGQTLGGRTTARNNRSAVSARALGDGFSERRIKREGTSKRSPGKPRRKEPWNSKMDVEDPRTDQRHACARLTISLQRGNPLEHPDKCLLECASLGRKDKESKAESRALDTIRTWCGDCG